MPDRLIYASNLSKCYHIYNSPQDRFKQLFVGKRKKYYHEFLALQDISFEIKKGETLGIIGRNGSGKSTLLQLICGILKPTSGNISVRGRVGALLELGAGFNPEFTGRENIYINGIFLKLSAKEIDAKLSAIEAFAEIGEFIDQPVKMYSSGMFVRLAFAVQSCIEPDILIIDEALGVGDIFFQQKCAKRIQELREHGTTLIFVSHDMSIMRDLCQRVIYLRQGKAVFIGDTTTGILHYLNEKSGTNLINPQEKTEADLSTTYSSSKKNFLSSFKATALWSREDNDELASSVGCILGVSVFNLKNKPILSLKMGERIKFRILYQSYTKKRLDVNIAIKNRYDQIIHSSGSYHVESSPPILKKGESIICELTMDFIVEAGNYTFSVMLGFCSLPNRGVVVDQTPWLGPLTVCWDYENEKAPWLGMFGIPFSLTFIHPSEME